MFNQLIASFQRQILPDRNMLRDLIHDADGRTRLLALPALRTYLASIATLRSGIDCATVGVETAAFIDAERAGDDVQTIYDDVVTHLQQCPECYERYELTRMTIDAQERGDLPAWTPTMTAAAPVPPLVLFVVPRHEFQRAATMRTRRAIMRGGRDASHLLFSGDLPEQPGAFVEVTLWPTPTPDRWRIVVAVLGTASVPDRYVRLQCGLETRVARTDAHGEATFDDIPDAWVVGDDAPDLEVGIAVD